MECEFDDPIREPTHRHRKWSDYGELLTALAGSLPDLITDGPELLDQSREPVYQDTGVAEL